MEINIINDVSEKTLYRLLHNHYNKNLDTIVFLLFLVFGHFLALVIYV